MVPGNVFWFSHHRLGSILSFLIKGATADDAEALRGVEVIDVKCMLRATMHDFNSKKRLTRFLRKVLP